MSKANIPSAVFAAMTVLLNATTLQAQITEEEIAARLKNIKVAPAGTLVITEPAARTKVAAGQSFSVTVVGRFGFVPESVLIVSSVDTAEVKAPPFAATLHVPADHLGPVKITAMAKNKEGVLAFCEGIEVEAETSATIKSISVYPRLLGLYLATNSDTEEIGVIGHFSDGVNRTVSGSKYGTKYSSQNPSVAAVDTEGLVRAKSLGEVRIDITNGDLITHVIVMVRELR